MQLPSERNTCFLKLEANSLSVSCHVMSYQVTLCTVCRKSGKGVGDTQAANIEAEYIRNLQQQVYFLELEANYLYPSWKYSVK